MKECYDKYGQIVAKNAILTNKANLISGPRRAKPLIMSGQFLVKSFVSHKRTAHDERFGFERRRFRYRSRPQGILNQHPKSQHPTSALGPNFNQQSQFNFRPSPGKTAHRSSQFRVKSFVSHKRTAHD